LLFFFVDIENQHNPSWGKIVRRCPSFRKTP